MIKEITVNSPLIIRLNKRAVKNHLGLAFKPALEGVSDLFLNTLMKTEDTLEGIASYEEKRKPEWKNR
jgi:cyclohexa-1,5-dienecarbonyl-CoA hydratase